MSVLVTGGAGFIGSHIVELLVAEGYKVIILDNLRTGKIENIKGVRGVELIRGDIRDSDLLLKLAEGVEVIVHMAAVVNVREFTENPAEGLSINVSGTINVLEAARLKDIEAVIFASSAAVYGEPKELPIREEHPTEPISLYGASKLAGEIIGFNYARSYGMRFIALRLFNVFGPRMPNGKRGNAIRIFVEKALKGEPIVIFGSGEQVRDFVYVKDVAQAFLKAIKRGKTGAYNIGTGIGRKIIEVAREILKLTGSKSEILFAERKKEDISVSIACPEKAKKELCWEPKYSFEEGLRETIDSIAEELRALGQI